MRLDEEQIDSWIKIVDEWIEDGTYIGLHEHTALRDIDYIEGVARVVGRDGERYVVSDDYMPCRINLEVKNGIVVRAYRG